ncbi:acyl-CoA N-acyltransferase [Hyaloscypha variabilis]
MSLTAIGKATPKPPPAHEAITIRRATLKDGPEIGRTAGITYYNTPLTCFLSPHREKHHAAYERGFVERAIARMLSPRNETYVACLPSGRIVGAAQFQRQGDDAGARRLVREVGVVNRIWMWVLGWLFWIYCKVYWMVRGPDRSSDQEAAKTFSGWCRVDRERYWDSVEERADRWHALSIIVLPEWQGRGIGRKLMTEVMKRAERDGVMVGLESSVAGGAFYRRLGFVLLGRFSPDAHALEGGGGEMAWYPPGYKNKIGEESGMGDHL